MKKLLLFAIAFCLMAGTSFSQISFGPKVGFNFSKYNQNFKDSDSEDDLKFKFGQSIGGVMDLTILEFLSFQPSVLFSMKGSSYDVEAGNSDHPNHTYSGYARERVMYMEIPLNIAGKYEIGPGTLQVFLGPYIAFAMGGRLKWDVTETKMDGTSDTDKGDEKIKFRNSVDVQEDPEEGVGKFMKAMDFGFDFGLGYQWNALLFNVGYQMGITNLQPDYTNLPAGSTYDPKDYKYTNGTIFVNAAWLFGGE